MGELRPQVSTALFLILFLGLLSTGAPNVSAASRGHGLSCSEHSAIDFDYLAANGPGTVRLLELRPPGGHHLSRKDADGRQDNEEGNDEIDIILMPSPAPDGTETTDALVRVRRPGILLVDSEDAPLAASFEPAETDSAPWTQETVHTDTDGRLAAGVWPGDYRLRVANGEDSPRPSTLRFRFLDPCSLSGVETGLPTFLCARSLTPDDAVVVELRDAEGDDLVTLGPGRYFLRVDGQRSMDGSYVLSVLQIDP